jgi:hypothetical protein
LKYQQNVFVNILNQSGSSIQLPNDKGIIWECVKQKQILSLQFTNQVPFYESEVDDFFEIDSKASLLIPVFDCSSNFVISVILVHSPISIDFFPAEDVVIAELFSLYISPYVCSFIEIENRHLEESSAEKKSSLKIIVG